MKNNIFYTLWVVLFAIVLFGCKANLIQKSEIGQLINNTNNEEVIATFILVRHAEKEKEKDPGLTAAGKKRANELAEVLKHIDLDVIYSSDYKRTKATAQPTCDSKKIAMSIYDASALEAFSDSLKANYATGKVLIVGHSNTTPELIRHLLGENKVEYISEDEYDNLFVIQFLKNGTSTFNRLKYGAPKS